MVWKRLITFTCSEFCGQEEGWQLNGSPAGLLQAHCSQLVPRLDQWASLTGHKSAAFSSGHLGPPHVASLLARLDFLRPCGKQIQLMLHFLFLLAKASHIFKTRYKRWRNRLYFLMEIVPTSLCKECGYWDRKILLPSLHSTTPLPSNSLCHFTYFLNVYIQMIGCRVSAKT